MNGTVIGILVGGKARRMGGVAKGMLAAPRGSERIIERLLRIAREVTAEVVLVGDAEAYDSVDCGRIRDAELPGHPTGTSGPLAGLVALLEHAGAAPALALACDLPYLTRPLAARLAAEPTPSAVLSPRSGRLWEPLFARYDSPRVVVHARARLAARQLTLQDLLNEVGVAELLLSDRERAELRDWDRPEDAS